MAKRAGALRPQVAAAKLKLKATLQLNPALVTAVLLLTPPTPRKEFDGEVCMCVRSCDVPFMLHI